VALMEGDHTGPFNIGNPGEFTVLQLAEMVKRVIPPKLPPGVKEPEIVYRENTSDDPKQRKPDITKAQTLLNWAPKVPLEEGLGPMIDEFKERICKKD